jgi:predicted aspartyl protease
MTVPVGIAGLGPFPFIVDTAATGTVISRELAAELQLEPASRVRMMTLTGSSSVMQVHVPDLTLTGGRKQDVRAFALAAADIGGHGILGIDVLRNRRVLLDFKARTFAVTRASDRWIEDGDPDTIVVVARRRLGQLILADASIDGEKIDVIVDTGAQVSLGNEALRRRLLKNGSRYKITPITLIGVTGGVLAADYTRVDRLRIGQAALIGMPIAFADAYPFRRLKLRKPALLLGMDALRMFERVTLDFANRRASFVLPEGVGHKPLAATETGSRR